MKVIRTHGKWSFSKDHKRAQVTVLIGEGNKQRSVTRHTVRRPGGWFGANPDERAIPLNKRYEDELAEAKQDFANAEAALKTLQKKLEVVQSVEPVDAVEITGVVAATAILVAMIETAELAVYAAEFIVDDAKSKLDIVRRDLPLEVEFTPPLY